MTRKSLSPLPMSLLRDQICICKCLLEYLSQSFHRHLKSNMSQNKLTIISEYSLCVGDYTNIILMEPQ